MSTPEDRLDRVTAVAVKGGIEAGAYAFAGSLLVSLLAQRLLPSYRSLTPPGKVLLVSVVTAGSAIIGAEHAIFHYNRPFLTAGEGRDGGTATWGETMFYHRYEAVAGGVAAAVAGGLLWFAGNKQRTGAEKFMSIRLFAHAVGLGGLLGLVSIASVRSSRSK